MPSFNDQSPTNRGFNWPAVVRTLLVQGLVLLALSSAFIGYLRWSSDANWAEFSSADKSAVPDARPQPQSSAPLQTVKGHAPCHRRS